MRRFSEEMENSSSNGLRKSMKRKQGVSSEKSSEISMNEQAINEQEKIHTEDDQLNSIKRKNKVGRHLTCLLCRESGHLARNCRLNKDRKIDLSICFNCGSSDHILKDCTQPKSSKLSFAVCFICKGEGHIAKDCPDNPNGLYPKGGCCYICQSKVHFSRDCPKREEQNKKRQGFSPETVREKASQPVKIQGDDELDEEPTYEVEEVRDDKQKRKKFNMKSKYYAKPKPKLK